MGKKKKIKDTENKLVKSINNGVRSSVRKLNPILKSMQEKKLMQLSEIYNFLKKELLKISERL